MVEKDILAHIDENEESVGGFSDNLVDVREKPDRTIPKIQLSLLFLLSLPKLKSQPRIKFLF